MADLKLSRRAFGLGMLAAGAGVTIRFPLALAQEKPKLTGMLARNPRLNGWVKIEPDGSITVFTGRVELGQGVRTALLQIAAEELDVSVEGLRLVTGDTALTPDEGYTAGSMSIPYGGQALGHACADARAALVASAAEAWSVPADGLAVRDGVIEAPDGRKMTYGEAAGRISLERDVDPAARRKDPKLQTVVGTSLPRVDIPGKVFGEASYVQDLRLEGMLFGAVARPPAYGATAAKIDLSPAERYASIVRTVVDGSFIGVIGSREEHVRAAAEEVAAATHWDRPEPLFGGKPVYDYLRTAPHDVQVVHTKGEVEGVRGKVVKTGFRRAFQSHGSIGASCAVAVLADGELTVWSHTQGVFPLRGDLAKVLGMPVEKIRVIHMHGSGCYGHNGADDVALDAALLALAVPGRPVRVLWTHEEEMSWEPYSPAMIGELEGVLDEAGKIAAWSHTVWSFPHNTRPGVASEPTLLSGRYRAEPTPVPPFRNGANPPGAADRNTIPTEYDFPNQKVVLHHHAVAPIRTSALRTLGAYMNVFSAECFMDDMAAAAGKDPVSFRSTHLTDPRLRAVMEKAVEISGWTPRAAGPRGKEGKLRGTGIGISRYKNSAAYVAVVATVEVDAATGEVRPVLMRCAVDAGRTVNPDGMVNQIMGGAVQAASQTLLEEAVHDEGIVTSNDYGQYRIMGFDLVPDVEVAVIDRPDQPSLGAGEGSHGPTAAALGNAVFDAIGKRVAAIPLTPERVLEALGA
jgi:nicotinate dehydrogenase subunit B